VYCVKCGKTIPEAAQFCPYCGGKVPVPGTAPEFEPERTSGMAIASLVLGILGFVTFGVTGLIGAGLGIIALIQIDRSQGKLGGKGLAVAGTALSGITVISIPIVSAIMFPVFARARESSRQAACQSNLKQLALGTLMYAQDNGNRLPLKDNWREAIYPYVRNNEVFHCPTARNDDSYAYNASLSGKSLGEIGNPADVVMLFDTSGGRNAAGGPELVDKRHLGGFAAAFVDGHVRWMREQRSVKWIPKPPSSPGAGGTENPSKGAPTPGREAAPPG